MTGDERTTDGRSEVDDPVRVLVISQLFPPESLGGSHRWKKLCENLPDGFECHVVCPPPTVPFGEFERTYRPWRRERRDGIAVTHLWTYQPRERTNIGRILNYAIFALHATLYVLVNVWRFDCVVTLAGPHTTLLPGMTAKLLGRSWVVDIYDLWIDNALELDYVDKTSLSYRVVSALERVALERCDHIIALTPTMATQLQEKHDLSADRFTAIPFGVDAELFAPGSRDDARPQVVYTGNLGKVQSFKPFFEAFAELDCECELLMVGPGERRAELERLSRRLGIADRVAFAGPLPRDEIPSVVAESALSWVPIRTGRNLDYARPTKFLETMAVGTPYVASAVAEIESVTEEAGAGVAVENDPVEIEAAMQRLLSNAELRREMGERGVKFVTERHRWDALGRRTADVLSNAVDATSGTQRDRARIRT